MTTRNESRNELQVITTTLQSPAMREQLKQSLPATVSLDRFIRTTLTAIQTTPAILEADRNSLYNAIVRAAQWNLMPDGRQGALTVFNTKVGDTWIKKAQFMVMIEGAITLFARAGFSAYAASVYEKDSIEVWNDDHGQHVTHRPVVFGDRGAKIGVFAAARDKDGNTYVATMNMDDISKVRAVSKAKDKDGNPTGPWRDWPDQMEQKSVLHRLRKRLNLSDTEADVLRADEEEAITVEAQPEIAHVEPPQVPAHQNGKGRPKALQAIVDEQPHVETDEYQPSENDL